MYADHNILHPYKSRTLNPADKIKVYRNLHNGLYSIKQKGLVVAHAQRLYLRDCKFTVRESGRQRVIKEKRKNVHAFIEGYITDSVMGTTVERNDLPIAVTYNPYLHNSFVNKQNNKPIQGAMGVILSEGGEVRAAYTH